MTKIKELEQRANIKFTDYQLAALTNAAAQVRPDPRMCLYYKTGAGKSLTALAALAVWDVESALVVAPPSTHGQWIAAGQQMGIDVEPMSHAKFRMKSTLISRSKAIIADEMHMFGGHTGQGWKKLDRLAQGLQAPLVLASATPNYNDADRVYCIQHVLDPRSCRGGFLEFLYQHCLTEQNPFGTTPIVTGFRNHPDAASYLASLPGVEYLPDDLTYTITDVEIPHGFLPETERYGIDRRRRRIFASQIEERHARVAHTLVNERGNIRAEIYDQLVYLAGQAATPVLIYANHSTVADALGKTLHMHGVKHAVVKGSTPKKKKDAYISAFRDRVLDVLVGTASLATGTDGMDKMCDTLIILDDTDDDSLRRQLIGRIMPRGIDGGDATKKQVYRFSIS